MKFLYCLGSLFFVCLVGCLNRYEREVAGSYILDEYEFVDSATIKQFPKPELILKRNKTFSFISEKDTIKGEWKADDYRDWTMATLYYDKFDIQAIVGINSLSIMRPREFNCEFLRVMTFHKSND